MKSITLELTAMANGGAALGRDGQGRPVFVPFTIPGETVQARIVSEKRQFARAVLVAVVAASPDRIEPRCPHFGQCGGCHFQHIAYERQLELKREVAADQLRRIGGLKDALVRPTLAHPDPWAYRVDVSLSQTPEGGLGYWSPLLRRVMPIDTCPIIHPRLQELWHDFDLELPGLRKLTLRVGDDGALLAALEVEGVEPPELAVDFPVSVAIVLPDRTAASLVGDSFLVRSVKGRAFRVSPGCFFQPSPAAAEQLVDSVLRLAGLTGVETVVELYSGVGMLTSFLSTAAARVIGVELNPDAVADAAVNLEETENVTLYQGTAEEVLPLLEASPEVMVVNPPGAGMSAAVIKAVAAKASARLVYVSADVATLARDGRLLKKAGYRLVEVQPVDMRPQTFHVDSVSLWLADGVSS
ncbi:MAG: class I SAM-dependent RNA methyltransferase [Anaerolineae bacterium]